MPPQRRRSKGDASGPADQDATATQPQQQASKRQRRAPAAQAEAEVDQQQHDDQAEAERARMSAFEAERAARIAANQARLAALELPQLAAGLAAAAAAAPQRPAPAKGVGARRRAAAAPLPRRHSARARGEEPDPTTAGGIDHEGRDGRVVLAAYVPQRYGGGSSSSSPSGGEQAAPARPPPGPLPFCSSNGDEASDAAFLRQLAAATAAAAAGGDGGGGAAAASAASGARLARLSLAASDVAKLTKDGISCLAWHPGGRPLIAAADKGGKVGLWDIDHQAAADDDGGYDGVLMFEPHSDYISSLRWLGPGGSALLTGSYDGLVRRLDVETGVWDLVGGLPAAAGEDGWSAGEATPDGAVMFLATSSGHLSVVDTRCSGEAVAGASSSSSPLLVANRKVNTLHLHGDGVHLASSASDGSVAVWDVRQLAASGGSGSGRGQHRLCKAVAAAQHPKSSQGVYWEPGGGTRLVSVSFDDTLRVWDHRGGALQQLVSIRHNNNTGRWVIPFRPAWGPAGDAVCVGDMKRGVALFDARTGASMGMLAAEALTAIPSRLAVRGCSMLAAATSSGRVHVFR